MTSHTSSHRLPYPTSNDKVKDGAKAIKALAEKVDQELPQASHQHSPNSYNNPEFIDIVRLGKLRIVTVSETLKSKVHLSSGDRPKNEIWGFDNGKGVYFILDPNGTINDNSFPRVGYVQFIYLV